MKLTPWFLLSTAALLGADRTIVSIHAATDIELTADPQSPFWRDVPPTVAINDQMGKVTPGHRTEIRTRWTEKNLYVLFVCPYSELYSKPNPVVDRETNHLWDWDTAEVFVGWDFKNTHRYKEFEVSPHGEWVDLDIDIDHPLPEQGWRWNSGFQSKARIDARAKVWYAEMQIPWKSIDERPVRAGNELRINFYRLQGPGPDRKRIAWQPTNARNFHVPEAFGILRLGQDVAEWLDGIAPKQLNKRDAAVSQSVDQARERQAFVRRKVWT
ncbi:MAG TPA: carbohydrate-binding family 9-like protein [Bryobacteraceae bacterium]|nr:carbohydrate-binding family 9-like protein [Bryobacteraceae bacterium]